MQAEIIGGSVKIVGWKSWKSWNEIRLLASSSPQAGQRKMMIKHFEENIFGRFVENSFRANWRKEDCRSSDKVGGPRNTAA
jgi:hypothetical protein